MIACFLVGFCSHRMSMVTPHRDWQLLPPREATLEIAVTELFNTRKEGRISGIGNILHSDVPHDTVSGNRISFYLENLAGDRTVSMVGESFSCRGALSYLPFLQEHDGFHDYLVSRGIFMTINRGSIAALTSAAPYREQVRRSHFDLFEQSLQGGREAVGAGNVLASMLLGNRRLLSDRQIDLYRNSGTYHLFAVSGLHVGCMAVFIGGLLRICRLPDRRAFPVVLLVIGYYVWLTGSSPSSVRSAIMIGCLMTGRSLWRQGHLFPALVASAWIVLLVEPRQMFSLGFQLSYAVVASIILIGLPVSNHLSRKLRLRMSGTFPGNRKWSLLARLGISTVEIACISLSAGCVSMPLIIQHFNLYTPLGVVTGILLNPIASAAIMVGCMVMLITPLSPVLASLLAITSWPLIWLMEWLIGIATQIPGSYSEKEWIWPHTGSLVVLLTLAVAWMLQYIRQQGNPLHPVSYLIPFLIVTGALGFGLLDA